MSRIMLKHRGERRGKLTNRFIEGPLKDVRVYKEYLLCKHQTFSLFKRIDIMANKLFQQGFNNVEASNRSLNFYSFKLSIIAEKGDRLISEMRGTIFAHKI